MAPMFQRASSPLHSYFETRKCKIFRSRISPLQFLSFSLQYRLRKKSLGSDQNCCNFNHSSRSKSCFVTLLLLNSATYWATKIILQVVNEQYVFRPELRSESSIRKITIHLSRKGGHCHDLRNLNLHSFPTRRSSDRSEERRVGKECTLPS